MMETVHQETQESPNRRDFEPGTYRRWHVMATMVEHEGKVIRKGRYILPLGLVRPRGVPLGSTYDFAASSYLIGNSRNGGRLQVQVGKWVEKPERKSRTHEQEPDTKDEGGREYECRFIHVKEWEDVTIWGVPHPVIGHFQVKITPRLAATGKFEGDPV